MRIRKLITCTTDASDKFNLSSKIGFNGSQSNQIKVLFPFFRPFLSSNRKHLFTTLDSRRSCPKPVIIIPFGLKFGRALENPREARPYRKFQSKNAGILYTPEFHFSKVPFLVHLHLKAEKNA